ncbi:MAG: hypothetical protein ABJC98_15740 [Bacteroidota bacterium]
MHSLSFFEYLLTQNNSLFTLFLILMGVIIIFIIVFYAINAFAITWNNQPIKPGFAGLPLKSPDKFKNVLLNMHPKTIQLFRIWLKFDYAFIPFFYAANILCIILLRNYLGNVKKSSPALFNYILLIIIAAAITDLLENHFTLKNLSSENGLQKATLQLMRLFSRLKWLFICLWIIALLILIVQ